MCFSSVRSCVFKSSRSLRRSLSCKYELLQWGLKKWGVIKHKIMEISMWKCSFVNPSLLCWAMRQTAVMAAQCVETTTLVFFSAPMISVKKKTTKLKDGTLNKLSTGFLWIANVDLFGFLLLTFLLNVINLHWQSLPCLWCWKSISWFRQTFPKCSDICEPAGLSTYGQNWQGSVVKSP